MMSRMSESVTVVGSEKAPLEHVLGPQVGRVYRELHEKAGIRFHLGVRTKSFLPSESRHDNVGFVELEDHTRISADIVILGVGITPETGFLKGAVQLDPDGGVPVDEYMRVRGQKDVYAAGDIARFPYFLTHRAIRIEHWDVAQQQGRIAGQNMAASALGHSLQRYQTVPFFFTMQYGKSTRYSGSAHDGYDDLEFVGETGSDSPSFAAYYSKSGRIVAVATMGKDPLAVHCGELLRQGKMPTLEYIRSGKVGKAPSPARP